MGEILKAVLCALVIYGGQTSSVSIGEEVENEVHSSPLELLKSKYFNQQSKLNTVISDIVQSHKWLEKSLNDKLAFQDEILKHRQSMMEKAILNRIGLVMDDNREQSVEAIADELKISQATTDSWLQSMNDQIVFSRRQLKKSFVTMFTLMKRFQEDMSSMGVTISSITEQITVQQKRPEGTEDIYNGSGDFDDGAPGILSEMIAGNHKEYDSIGLDELFGIPLNNVLYIHLQPDDTDGFEEISEQNEQIIPTLTNTDENWSQNPTVLVDGSSAVVYQNGESQPILRSCSEAPTYKSGLYWLQPFAEDEPFEGFCEQDKFQGGWLVFQYRFNGSVDFYRGWEDYKAGFGQPTGEFWLGLEQLHRLTASRKHILMVELETFDGEYGYAQYDRFEIGSESENYYLKQLGDYSGTAGNSLELHRGMNFTTSDRDNDVKYWNNCALEYSGAWWYEKCHHSNLNGPYVDKYTAASNCWLHMTHYTYQGLKMTRMMIKEA